MNRKWDFQWLPVTTLPDGTELRLPLHVLKGARPGPTLGLSAAIHGDEIIPTVGVIQRVLELLDPAELSGTVMAVPILNALGVGERSRHTPGDGMNLNEAFGAPGPDAHIEPVKTATEQIADVATEGFLRHLNYLIDFHNGGDNHSVHMIEFTEDRESTGMARAFNMPILLKDTWGPRQMWKHAETLGVKTIVAELGGGGFLYNEWLERGVRGTFNVMRCLGMLSGKVEPPPKQYVVNNTPGHGKNLVILRPREGGLIVPDPAIDPQKSFDGQPVVGVPVLGRLLNPYDLTVRQTFDAPFARTLMLAAVVSPSWNFPGEFAYILANADVAEIWD
jgi:hypothetical protein